MEDSKKVYFENLNGLRFICFLSVFLYHSFHTNFDHIKDSNTYSFANNFLVKNGNLGVNFFFVLSGFLITYLLLKEIELIGRIDVISFWKRRIFRIWPLFYACVFFGFVIFPILKRLAGQVPNETADVWYYISFLNNFDFIKKGLPDSSVLGVLWSVAIEEQFYLMWPILLYLIPKRFYPYLFGVIIAQSILFRSIYQTNIVWEFHTFSCIGDLALGALGAWAVNVAQVKEKIRRVNVAFIIILYSGLFFILFFKSYLNFLGPFERTFIALCFLLVILEQNYADHSLFKMKNLRLISNLGVITYGLYCLHFISILITTNITSVIGLNTEVWEVLFMETTIALLISILIAKLSYHFYETPFLKLGRHFSYINTEGK